MSNQPSHQFELKQLIYVSMITQKTAHNQQLQSKAIQFGWKTIAIWFHLACASRNHWKMSCIRIFMWFVHSKRGLTSLMYIISFRWKFWSESYFFFVRLLLLWLYFEWVFVFVVSYLSGVMCVRVCVYVYNTQCVVRWGEIASLNDNGEHCLFTFGRTRTKEKE